jgi:agmatinase
VEPKGRNLENERQDSQNRQYHAVRHLRGRTLDDRSGRGGVCKVKNPIYPYMTKRVRQFLDIEGCKPSLRASRFVVVPVPYERTVSYRGGTAKGPQAVLDASPQVELWDEEIKTETWKDGIYTFPPVNCKGSAQVVFKRIENKAREIMACVDAIPFYLGGEHSVSQALIAPYIEKYKNLSVFHFDAHADLRREYFGNPRSHACALYPASRKVPVVQAGIRSVGCEEKQNINAGKVKTFLMHENLNIKKLIPQVLKSLKDTVYMTIDVDGFDPSVIPGTGTPQPGGFGWYEGLALFKAICESKKIVAVDIVETAPQKNSNITEMNIAKLLYRLMGYLRK